MPKASSRPPKSVASAKSITSQQSQGVASTRQAISHAEAAQYIAEFSAELAYLAREANLDVLSYMLEMARIEAMEAARAE
jgi:hypothetical protein